ncbi:DUF6249 domain-containing protein [Kangiella sp. TOML190]|uniref:DUF6249 domain-containing protein n=1 Tax=Kangiella sp. TOML190 TaxID=2931351 RepID=UPI00203DB815|nr:DUF6249 domain-containing protein [Kangiella sp. TOML190]
MGEELWIPIVMFISLAAVIISFFYYGHKNKLATMKTVQKAVENGSNLTPELLEKLSHSKAVQPPRIKDLRRGIILSALGVAGVVASFMFSSPEPKEFFRIISLLPLFIGAGFLLVWKLNRYND